MLKELGIKLNKILKKAWIAYIAIGIIFLGISASGLFLGVNINKYIIKMLGILFVLGGISNLGYSLSEIKDKRFCWGEIFFRGCLEIFSGWLILWKKISGLETEYGEQVSKTVGKIAAADIKLDGYFIIFYVGLFLIFRGLIRLFTKLYNYDEKSKMNYSLLRFLIGTTGLIDFAFGICVMIVMYLDPLKFKEIINIYIFIESILMILIGIVIKMSSEKIKKIEMLEEKEKIEKEEKI